MKAIWIWGKPKTSSLKIEQCGTTSVTSSIWEWVTGFARLMSALKTSSIWAKLKTFSLGKMSGLARLIGTMWNNYNVEQCQDLLGCQGLP